MITKELETKRLILRKINENDYQEAYTSWCADPEVTRYVTWNIHENEEVTKEYFNSIIEKYKENKTYDWIIELKETHEVIGSIDIAGEFINYNCGELGYVLAKKYWGKGYMPEAANKVLEYMFTECNFDIITARHLSLNPKSGRVMQKLGMKNEGALRIRIIDKDGIRNDIINYSITKEEYNELNKR